MTNLSLAAARRASRLARRLTAMGEGEEAMNKGRAFLPLLRHGRWLDPPRNGAARGWERAAAMVGGGGGSVGGEGLKEGGGHCGRRRWVSQRRGRVGMGVAEAGEEVGRAQTGAWLGSHRPLGLAIYTTR